jgi:serine protease Do
LKDRTDPNDFGGISMKFLQTTALTAALLGAAGLGAAVTPPAGGQSRVTVAEPRAAQVFSLGGGRLGVSISDLDTADAKGTGVRIDEVEEGSPAEKAGFQKGDVVVEFDGERVRSARQFSRLVSETPAGRQVAAAVTRGGQRVSLNVATRESSSAFNWVQGDNWRALEELREGVRIMPTPVPPRAPVAPRAPAAPRAPQPPAVERFFYSGNQLGASVNGLTDQLQEHFGAKGGVLVTSVTEDSAAAKAGLEAGDVIVRVNGAVIDDPSDLRQRMQRLDAGEEFTLEIVRDRKTMTLKGKTEARQGRRWTTRTVI